MFIKKRLQCKCLPVNFAKFFRGPTFVKNLQKAAFGNAFLHNTSERLLLHFRGFNFYGLKKIVEFPVKPATLLTIGLF